MKETQLFTQVEQALLNNHYFKWIRISLFNIYAIINEVQLRFQ